MPKNPNAHKPLLTTTSMKLAILLPPSQRKTSGGKGKPIQANPITKELLKEILTYNPHELYSSRHEEAEELNREALKAPTKKAIERYDGVVYKAIAYNTLTNQEYIDKHVKIISPLFGVLDATDAIPNYKFDITKLQAYKKWKEYNTNKIRGYFVIDLLPQSYKKSIEYEQGVAIEFTREKNGKIRKAGHAGKTIKGTYVRWLAENNITREEDLYAFNEDGYAWSGKTFHQNKKNTN